MLTFTSQEKDFPREKGHSSNTAILDPKQGEMVNGELFFKRGFPGGTRGKEPVCQ